MRYHEIAEESPSKAGRSKVGGENGINGFFYKGGQFLPNTMAEPGKWKIGKKWVHSRQVLIAPGEMAYQPTPFSASIYQLIGVGSFTRQLPDGRIVLYSEQSGRPMFDHTGEEITLNSMFRPGVQGVQGTEEFSLRELIDLYQNGSRWIDVNPNAETITTKA